MIKKPDIDVGDLVRVQFPGFDTFEGWVEWEEYIGIVLEINYDDSDWKESKFRNGRWYIKFIEIKTFKKRTQWAKYAQVLSKIKKKGKTC